MKKNFTLSIMCFLMVASIFAQDRRCATMENLEYRKQLDPQLEQRMTEIENFTQAKIQALENNPNAYRVDGSIITIPVVVHVLYTNSTENISVAQIQSQLDVLNEDFRRTNPDADNTWSQAADTQIEFCLSTVDPNGNATTGITRKSTTRSDWGANDEAKRSSSGGIDPWNTAEYLNMWIVPKMTTTSGGQTINLLGYAQFPGGSAATDGLVMIYNAFGRTGAVSSPYDGGRTTTHEIGHYFNLRHIWGDSNCGNDFVSDTPTHQTSNYGCPTGQTSCSSTDMVENYMDYTNDSCMNLFTQGQKTRMRAVLEAGGARRTLALSDKCGATGTTPTCTDGIQNGDETGIDCGGSSCAPCQTGTQYCDSQGNNANDEYISRVQVGTINNTSGAQLYSDFTSVSTDLDTGSSYTLTVTPTWTGSSYSEGYAAWIDYNDDGDFTDAGEQIFSLAASSVTPASGSFTVPTGTASGDKRLRVSMKYNGVPTSCEAFSYGEVEDYTVNITTGVADTVKPVITLTGSATINLTVGDTYSELGATATDNIDGNLTSSIVITGTVNTNTAGTYTRNYNVSDAAGNPADQVSRSIVVSPASTTGCSGAISSFPYNEGFESSFGAWTQGTGDDFNWTRQSGATPSSNTGPSSASEGSQYIFMESSSPNYSTKRAILNSPCFDLNGESQATFTFAYHMYGTTAMGSLAVEASSNNGSSWASVWSVSGNQGNAWETASVDLSAYAGGTVQLRFNGVTGTTWQGDMAVDAVSLSTSGGSTGTTTDVSLSITFDNYPEETSWTITDGSNSVVASGGTYGNQADGSTLNLNETLPAGCYSFTISDVYGDGICCSYGNGSYSLTDGGNVLVSGSSFTSSETTTFCVGGASSATYSYAASTVETLDNQFKLYPNPVKQTLNVSLIGLEAQRFEIKNLLGQTVLQGRYTNSINVSKLQDGMYVLQLHIGEKTKVKKFIKH
ncbi:GEVED domain-containing protein [Lacinutrix sp. WUR7]|uniref:GEVED domain-containing protein n=1 Tax=Lacinutrix sp. WUR7 TaxID=2653681 RepID=UPI001EEFE2E7|nr:GEVED domain-containing protein [Lacinutrix sp. WUR7]